MGFMASYALFTERQLIKKYKAIGMQQSVFCLGRDSLQSCSHNSDLVGTKKKDVIGPEMRMEIEMYNKLKIQFQMKVGAHRDLMLRPLLFTIPMAALTDNDKRIL